MKKAIIAILAVNMILSSFAVYADTAREMPVYGESVSQSTEDIQKLVSDVKSKINIPNTLSELESGKTTYKNMTTYEFSWHDKEYENSIDVYVNDKGDITSYHTYFYKGTGDFNDRYAVTALTDDEIKSIAEKWFTDIGVSFVGELDFDNAQIMLNVDNADIYVNILRKVNGIEFPDNYVSLELDKASGEITDYYSNWNYGSVPSAENVIDISGAQNSYKQSGAIELVYETDYNGDEKTAVLRYTVGGKAVDAKTGQVQSTEARYATLEMGSGAVENSVADKYSSALTAEEIGKINELTSLISEKEAEKIARSLENTALDKYGVNAYNYNKYGDKYTVDIGMSDENDAYANVTLDAVTGEVIYVFVGGRGYDYSAKDTQLSETEAKEVADRFVERYNTKKTEYVYSGCSDNTVEYVRKVNGIPFYDNKVTVGVSPKDKTICSYVKNYTDNITFETADAVISEDKAYESLFENGGFKLYYDEFGVDGDEIKLVYRPRRDVRYVNPFGANVGELNDDEKIYPSDMTGHYAEKAVNSLVRNGVITLTNDKFSPDDTLNQKDALQMLSVFYGWYSPRTSDDTDAFYKIIIRRGFLTEEEKNPEELVKREKAAKYIVNAIGYGSIKHISDDVFDSGFNDSQSVSAEYNRYVAAAKGLGIVNGDENGNFNPQKDITKGQFAIMIYNALTNNR